MSTFLDWNDPAAVRQFLVDAKIQADDLDATVQDMLRPLDERELGPVMHAEKCGEAMHSLLSLLDYAIGPEGFPALGQPDDPTH